MLIYLYIFFILHIIVFKLLSRYYSNYFVKWLIYKRGLSTVGHLYINRWCLVRNTGSDNIRQTSIWNERNKNIQKRLKPRWLLIFYLLDKHNYFLLFRKCQELNLGGFPDSSQYIYTAKFTGKCQYVNKKRM